MNRWPIVPLEDFVAKKSGSVDPAKFPDEVFDLYSIPAFDAGQPDVRAGSEIGSAKQVVQPNDVLLSRIVPHIRRAWVVGESRSRRLIASGEWIVFRSPQIRPRYLRYFLVGDPFHAQFMQTVSGVGGSLLRAKATEVAKIKIPVPALAEQERIVKLLDEADELRKLRAQADRRTTDLIPALFHEIFGDPETNSLGWPSATVKEVISSTKLGLVRGAKETDDSLPFPYVRMDAILGDGNLALAPIKRVNATPAEVAEFSLRDGDFLFNTRNSRELVGKTALFEGSGTYLFNNNIMRIRFNDSIEPRFMIALFQTDFIKRQLEVRKSGTTSVVAIYFRNLSNLEVIVPPLFLQKEFAARVTEIRAVQAEQTASRRRLENLFQSMLHRAFKGEV